VVNKIIKNGAINFLTLLIPALLFLVATPFLTRWLGMERYGIWVLCVTLLGLSDIFDLGLKVTAITFIPKCLTENDSDLLALRISSLLSLVAAIGLILSLILFSVSTILVTRIFSIANEYQIDSILAFKILSIGLLPSLTINLLSAIAMGYQRFDLSTALMVGRNTLNIIGTVIVVALTRQVSSVIIYMVILSWVLMFLGIGVLMSAVPAKKIFRRPTMEIIKETLSFGWFSFIFNITMLAMGVFDKLIIGALLGPIAVAVYSISMSLAAKLEQVVVKFAQAIFPRLSEIADEFCSGSERRSDSRGVCDLALDASLLVGLGTVGLLFVSTEPLLRIWMGAEFSQQATWLLRGLLLGYVMRIANIVPSYILFSQKKPKINALANSLSGFLYIGLIVLLVGKVSLGALAFSSLAYIISTIVLAVSIGKYLEKNVLWHLWPYLVSVLVSGILTSLFMLNYYKIKDINMIILSSLVFSVSYILGSYFLSNSRENSLRCGFHLLKKRASA